jgi:hypothetical protein
VSPYEAGAVSNTRAETNRTIATLQSVAIWSGRLASIVGIGTRTVTSLTVTSVAKYVLTATAARTVAPAVDESAPRRAPRVIKITFPSWGKLSRKREASVKLRAACSDLRVGGFEAHIRGRAAAC